MHMSARILILCCLFAVQVQAQKQAYTVVRGQVTDAENKSTIPFASISVPGMPIGVRTDVDGNYELKTDKPITQIKCSVLGYESKTIDVKTGKQQVINIVLAPSSEVLGEVTIKAEKYRNKNNPAVELIQLVVQNRDKNHIQELQTYHDEQYEKIFFGLSHLRDKMKDRRMLKSVRFLLDNTDTSKVEGLGVVPVFLQENFMDYYSQKNPKKWKKYITASKSVQFPGYVDQEGMNKILQYMYEEIDIYDNYITLLTDQFLSPIANNAPLFYRYYPKDTSIEDGRKIVRLEFYPRNKTDMLLQGDLFIALDSTYPVKRINFTINPAINLNWVTDLDITQDYQFLPNGKCILNTEDYRLQFGLSEKSIGMAAQRFVVHRNPQINQTLPDSLFKGISEIVHLPISTKTDTAFFTANRPTPLNHAEEWTYRNMDSLQQTKFYRIMSQGLYILIGAYTPVGKNFEIGPINSFYAFNAVEGTRIRFGGHTSSNLSNRFKLDAWVAYGFKDERLKYYIGGTFALPGTQYNKFPVNLFRVNYTNDVLLPGQNFQGTQLSNLGSSVVRGVNDKFFLTHKLKVEYEREFDNHFSYIVGVKQQDYSALGALRFEPASGGAPEYKPVTAASPYLQLRYGRGEKNYQSSNSNERVLIDFNYIATLRYSKGINGFMGGQYNYHEVVGSIYKYTDVPPFGYNILYMEAGGLFGKVPYPFLTIHRGNQSYFNQVFSYNLMNFMEFISDRYATVITEHYFNGFFLNKIPLLRRLKWREVCTFKMIYGGVSAQNRPDANSTGLYKFPTEPDGTPITHTLEKKPYAEMGIGVSNIFRVLRIDYIQRLSYLQNPGISKSGIRASIVLTF
jgi:hypothetical protein